MVRVFIWRRRHKIMTSWRLTAGLTSPKSSTSLISSATRWIRITIRMASLSKGSRSSTVKWSQGESGLGERSGGAESGRPAT